MRDCFNCFLKFFLSILCIILFSSKTKGQNNSTLRILVTSQSEGTPFIGANVILRTQKKQNKEYEIVDAGVTDKDGFQEFREISAGQYQLQVSFVGYEEYHTIVNLKEGQTQVKQIRL